MVIGSHKRKVLGNMAYNEISIAHVDGPMFCFEGKNKVFGKRCKNLCQEKKNHKRFAFYFSSIS